MFKGVEGKNFLCRLLNDVSEESVSDTDCTVTIDTSITINKGRAEPHLCILRYYIRYVTLDPFSCSQFYGTSLADYRCLQVSFVRGGCYNKIILCSSGDSITKLYDAVFNMTSKVLIADKFLSPINAGYVYNRKNNEKVWIEIDQEVIALYSSPFKCTPYSFFVLYTEPGPHVVDRTTCKLELDNNGSVLTINEVVELEVNLFPSLSAWEYTLQRLKSFSKQTYWWSFFMNHNESVSLGKEGTEVTEDWNKTSGIPPEMSLSCKLGNCYSEMADVDPNSNLGLMWIVAEAEIQKLIAECEIPGSSIASGGLDPDSFEHFEKCIEEIVDEIFNQNYSIAVSHFRGAKSVFAESNNTFLESFFEGEPVSRLKHIFFNSQQQ